MIYAVIDTNVIVSAFLAENKGIFPPPRAVLHKVATDDITPVLHEQIIAEYNEVLFRDKFHFNSTKLKKILDMFHEKGIHLGAAHFNGSLPDESDRIFLEVALAARQKYGDACLVTGNKKHFPDEPFILSPAELLAVAGE